MKKILLIAAAALMVTSVNAQMRRSETAQFPAKIQKQLVKPEAKMEVKEMRTPGTVAKAPAKAGKVNVFYNRPDGAFTGSVVIEDGANTGMYYAPYICVKPYCDYTFKGVADGYSEGATFEWDVQSYGVDDAGEEGQFWYTVPGMDLTWQWGLESDEAPIFYCIEPDGSTYSYQLVGHEVSGTSEKPIMGAEHKANVLSLSSIMEQAGIDILKSSKTMVYGGINQDQRYPFTYYSGADPYGRNETGWWFGKNGGINNGKYRLDGIAQAFEKPEHPYLLNYVAMDCAVLNVTGQVDMYCKIYKLDEIPAYNDSMSVILPDEPGELIAMGRATLTPETATQTGDFVFFTLYGEEDGLEYDITPTIDSPILVVVDGYNEPEMANLADFSALIVSDDMVDEGKGELAYLKVGYNDEDGNLDHYIWEGLNNFFSSGQMMTGLSIYLSTDLPYLTYNYTAEDGFYKFADQGGVMEKTFGTHVSRSIEFWSSVASADDAWFVSCDDEEVPAWLNIELNDEMTETGEFSGLVNAVVTAQPLPAGVTFRKAVVRFEFPGAYLDYTFVQGEGGDVTEQLEDKDAVAVGYYDMMGRQQQGMQQGINIVKMSDGSARKVLKK